MKMYDISVIIPVYNVEKYVSQCIDSVFLTEKLNLEIIYIDDNSADKSSLIVEDYINKYNNMKMIKNNVNLGLSAARNLGMNAAEGKYIYFLDSDDYLKPYALNTLYELAESNGADVIYFDTEVLCEEEYLWDKIRNYRAHHKYQYPGIWRGDELFRLMKKRNDLDTAVWRQFWRKSALESIGVRFFEGIYHEDNLFSIQAMLSVKRAMCLNQCLHVYRYREGSITSKQVTAKHFWSMCKVYSELLRFWMEHEFEKDIEEEFSNYMKFIVKRIVRYYNELPQDFHIDFEDKATNFEKHIAKILVGQLL